MLCDADPTCYGWNQNGATRCDFYVEGEAIHGDYRMDIQKTCHTKIPKDKDGGKIKKLNRQTMKWIVTPDNPRVANPLKISCDNSGNAMVVDNLD